MYIALKFRPCLSSWGHFFNLQTFFGLWKTPGECIMFFFWLKTQYPIQWSINSNGPILPSTCGDPVLSLYCMDLPAEIDTIRIKPETLRKASTLQNLKSTTKPTPNRLWMYYVKCLFKIIIKENNFNISTKYVYREQMQYK